MTDPEFLKALNSTKEVEITVAGRKSGRSVSTPVWFVHEGTKLYLVPVNGSDSNWYRNLVAKPEMQITAKGRTVPVKANPMSDASKVKEVVEKLRSKYGAAEVKKYYSKPDVAVEIAL